MVTDFSNKCEVLGKLSVDRNYLGRIPDYLIEWVFVNEFILTLAWCIKMGYAEINDKTIELIDNAYLEYLEIGVDQDANGI